MNKQYFVYILTNKKYGTFYVGITDNLTRRVYEHKNDLADGFTKKYRLHTLVYFENTSDINTAISQEKKLKRWKREWKIKLIEDQNPTWKDLYNEII